MHVLFITWASYVIDYISYWYRAIQLRVPNIRLQHLRVFYTRLSNKDFGRAYRCFEQLQQLKYDEHATCDCGIVGVDGIVVGIQRKQFFCRRDGWDCPAGGIEGPRLPNFLEHALIKSDVLRILLLQYVIILISSRVESSRVKFSAYMYNCDRQIDQ
jgi:hypothetical protein